MSDRLSFGILGFPIHHLGQNPTLAYERDLQLVEHVEMLGFEEAWFGEHHSTGFEFVGAPDLMIAAAAARTRRIKLGTGVNSLPYHHPFILADRWLQLDHMTRGRTIFGTGPGALPSDAVQIGIDPQRQRQMMSESLEVILRLLRGETVSRETDWFVLREARLQLAPYSWPLPDIRVATFASPSGPRAAGSQGLGMVSMAATSKGGFEGMRDAWSICEEEAAAHGQTVDRDRWAVCAPMHLAPTEAQAREEVEFGLFEWFDYFRSVSSAPLPTVANAKEAADYMLESGWGTIGTPAQAIAQIERLLEQSGGFGSLLVLTSDWADWGATLRSLELVARYVMPHFQGQLKRQRENYAWVADNEEEFTGAFARAQEKATADYQAEKSKRIVR